MADSVLPVESAKNRRFYQRVASSNHSAVHSESGQKTIDQTLVRVAGVVDPCLQIPLIYAPAHSPSAVDRCPNCACFATDSVVRSPVSGICRCRSGKLELRHQSATSHPDLPGKSAQSDKLRQATTSAYKTSQSWNPAQARVPVWTLTRNRCTLKRLPWSMRTVPGPSVLICRFRTAISPWF